MAKKHANYRPQQRRRTTETQNQNIESSDLDHTNDPEGTVNVLADKFEIDKVVSHQNTNTYLGSVMSSVAVGGELLLESDRFSSDELRAIIPELVVAIREAALELADDGYNVVESHEIIPRRDSVPLFKKATEKQLNGIESLKHLIDSPSDELFNDEALEILNGLRQTAYLRLLRVYMLSKGMSRIAQEGKLELNVWEDYRDGSLKGLEREMSSNPSSVRRETTKDLQFIFSDEVSSMLDYFGYIDDPLLPQQSIETDYPIQELDFTVLPKGTDLYDFAHSIVDRVSEYQKAYIDLERVNVLNSIREYVGTERSYFAHGKKTGHHMINPETDSIIDEDYIVLIIQDLDNNGNTQGEHALAVSPIAKKHAAYLTRHDSSAGNWREVLSLPKYEARYFGARDLRFTGSTGRTPYAMMEEKIKALLTCHPDDFHEKLRMRADGTYRLVNNARDIGHSASKHLLTSKNSA